MGLVRSQNTDLTPEDDSKLVNYLWPIVREMIKTAIENKQNLIVEGCYIPFGWQTDFAAEYLCEIRYYCLVMSEKYIKKHFEDIKIHANEIEQRIDDSYSTIKSILEDNVYYLKMCKKFGYDYILIDEEYLVDIEI